MWGIMAGNTITIASTSDTKLYLLEEYNKQEIEIIPENEVYYKEVEDRENMDTWSVRKAEGESSISAISEYVDFSQGTLEVADGSIFRKGETVKVFDGLDSYHGSVYIRDIDGNDISYSQVLENDTEPFDILVGYKLYFAPDSSFFAGYPKIFDTKRYKYMLLNGDGKVSISIKGSGEKKNY